MKNIFVLPTTQPSRLWINNLLQGKLELSKETLIGSNTAQHMYITSDEEIKEGDWGVDDENVLTKFCTHFAIHSQTYFNYRKVTLTTDPTLIADGVQSIDDKFLEWFVKNPTCGFIKVTKLDYLTNRQYRIYNLPQEEPKQDLEKEMFELEQEIDIPSSIRWHNSKPKQSTLEEAADKANGYKLYAKDTKAPIFNEGFIAGAKWQAERMYSEEDLREAFKQSRQCKIFEKDMPPVYETFEEWLKQFKKK